MIVALGIFKAVLTRLTLVKQKIIILLFANNTQLTVLI